MTEPFPYRCEYGYMCQSRVDFATFAEALAYYRGFRRGSCLNRPEIRIINHTNIDGADDAKPWAQAGLTEDEWEQIENL
jgi:hypothetical protein